ncbi:MAG: GNAT family N-acetyltransferase [Actinomycetales bacterium]|nr:GNAT family N-acetyltransferase [Actinomycetales bacterium]
MPLAFRAASPADPEATELLAEYVAFRTAGFAALGRSYAPATPDPSTFAPPHGVFLIASVDGRDVGCGGVRMLPAEPRPGDGSADTGAPRGEIKHLWIRPDSRRTGAGRALLAELERRAVGLGAREAVLDTHESLAAAQRLYRAAGYRATMPYNANPNATHWFAKTLVPGTVDDAEAVRRAMAFPDTCGLRSPEQ